LIELLCKNEIYGSIASTSQGSKTLAVIVSQADLHQILQKSIKNK